MAKKYEEVLRQDVRTFCFQYSAGSFGAWWRSVNVTSHSSLIRIKHPSVCFLAEKKCLSHILCSVWKRPAHTKTWQLNPYWCHICILPKWLLFSWIHVAFSDKTCSPSHSKAVKCFNIVKDVVVCLFFYYKPSLCPLFLDDLPPFLCADYYSAPWL